MACALSADSTLEEYLLLRGLDEDSEVYYRRVVTVYSKWANKSRREFSPRDVSEFLKHKQEQGCSSWYLKSLRNGLRALLKFSGQHGPIRTVRLTPLTKDVWNADEVSQLRAAVPRAILARRDDEVAIRRRRFWTTIIPAAWWTGLSQVDLSRLTRAHVTRDGVVTIHRSRTNKLSVTEIPADLARIFYERPGAPWKLQTSVEYFRYEFSLIVAAANMQGTFKKLRKSSGTDVEKRFPGQGHIHLANTRQVFELHYLSEKEIRKSPPRPSPLPE